MGTHSDMSVETRRVTGSHQKSVETCQWTVVRQIETSVTTLQTHRKALKPLSNTQVTTHRRAFKRVSNTLVTTIEKRSNHSVTLW